MSEINKDDLLKDFEKELKQTSIVNLDALKPNLDRTFKEGKPKGEPTFFPPIDDRKNFSWKRGFLYCFTGNPGNGKSEFLNTLLLLKSINSGWRWLVYSPESYPVEDYIDTLSHTLIGKSTDPEYSNQMTKKEYDKAFNFIKSHFQVLQFNYMPTYQEILEIFKTLDYDGLIIDPFNSLDDNADNISRHLKKALSEFKIYASLNEKVIILVEHPHSANSLDDDGNPRMPSEYTLNGGKMWHNKCDVIAIVHRPLVYSDPTDTNVYFKTSKIKNQKLNGIPDQIEFNFDRAKNRYFKFHESGDGRRVTGFDEYKVNELDINTIPISNEWYEEQNEEPNF